MRILQLIAQSTLGGAETFGYSLGAELARRGHHVLLLSNRSNGPLLDRSHPPGLTVRALDRKSRLDPRILSFLAGSILRFRPEILHSHNFEANTWARTLGFLFPRLSVICHEHSGRKIHQGRRRAWLDRALYPRCAAVFVVNEELGELLRRRHRVPARFVHVTPNGIDVERFTPPPAASRDPLHAVCVASLTDVKNHAGLLRAWREVVAVHPAAHLTLVGDGPLRRDLEVQARAQGIQAGVTFAGLQADIRPYLWHASYFVLFSHREALPLSLLEAMAAGCVCLAPGVGGIPDAISEGSTGHLFPAGDEQALARILTAAMGTPAESAAMGARAREEAARRFNLKACVDEIEATYRAVRGKR